MLSLGLSQAKKIVLSDQERVGAQGLVFWALEIRQLSMSSVVIDHFGELQKFTEIESGEVSRIIAGHTRTQWSASNHAVPEYYMYLWYVSFNSYSYQTHQTHIKHISNNSPFYLQHFSKNNCCKTYLCTASAFASQQNITFLLCFTSLPRVEKSATQHSPFRSIVIFLNQWRHTILSIMTQFQMLHWG